MSLKFKPEDFKDVFEKWAKGYWQASDFSNCAQSRFDAWLAEQPRIWSMNDGPVDSIWVSQARKESCGQQAQEACAHTARLVAITELPKEPCKHEPIVEIYGAEVSANIQKFYNVRFETQCKHCGVKLIAEWKPVQE